VVITPGRAAGTLNSVDSSTYMGHKLHHSGRRTH